MSQRPSSQAARSLGGSFSSCRRYSVVLRPLSLPVEPVDKQPLDPGVALAAGVHGEVDPLGEIVHAPHAGAQPVHPLLRLLGGLVHEQHVHLQALKAQGVPVVVAVAKEDAAPVREADGFAAVVIEGDALLLLFPIAAQQLAQGEDVVFPQLRVGLAHDHHRDAGVAQAQEHRLHAHGPALAAAPRPAVGHHGVPVGEKQPLLLAGLGDLQFRHVCRSFPSLRH